MEIYTQNVSTIPFAVIEKPDDTLPAGQTKVKQAGSDGGVVNTFKKVTENGKVVYDKMIHTSRYSPINKIVLVSTEVEEIPQEAIPETQLPADESQENAGDEPVAEEITDISSDIGEQVQLPATESTEEHDKAE